MGYIDPSTLLVALVVCLLFYSLARLPEIGGELLAGTRFVKSTSKALGFHEDERTGVEQGDRILPPTNS